MARPPKSRRICQMPTTSEFSPKHQTSLEYVTLGIDEFEVIRLIDQLGLNQSECANQMHVARTTVQAIYDSARKKIAEALVDGKTLVIQGGSYHVCPSAQSCCGKGCNKRQCNDGDQPCPEGACPCR